MPSQIRSAVASGVATVLALAVVTLVPTRAGAEDAAHPHVQQLLRAAAAAFATPHREPGTRLPYRDVGLLLRDLRAARPRMSTAERAAADRYLAPSVASAGPSTSCSSGLLGLNGPVIATDHFCIHYSGNATTYAQTTAQTLEQVYATEVGTLGYRAPLSDGDGRLDVDLTQDLGRRGIYGYCSTSTSAAQSPAYCALDNDFAPAQYGAPAINSLRVTAAHEFFHAIQFAYDADQETWAMEGTAVWAEDEVFPSINDYLQYLRFSPVREPATPIDSNGTFERYGIVVFWKFLAEYLHDRNAIRQFWQYADAPGGRSALRSVVALLAAHHRAFGPTFAAFAAWNTLPPGSYRDRGLWPAPAIAATATLSSTARVLPTRIATLDHLSSTALRIRPSAHLASTARLRVVVDGPVRSTSPHALVQLRMRDRTVRYLTVPLDRNGDGARTVLFDRTRVASVVVTLSNASLARADDRTFGVSARVVR